MFFDVFSYEFSLPNHAVFFAVGHLYDCTYIFYFTSCTKPQDYLKNLIIIN